MLVISVPKIASPFITPVKPPWVSLILECEFTVPSIFNDNIQTAPCQIPPSSS